MTGDDYTKALVEPIVDKLFDILKLQEAARLLEQGEPDGPLHFFFYPSELKAMGYELADHVKPGDVFQWQSNTITVMPITIPGGEKP